MNIGPAATILVVSICSIAVLVMSYPSASVQKADDSLSEPTTMNEEDASGQETTDRAGALEKTDSNPDCHNIFGMKVKIQMSIPGIPINAVGDPDHPYWKDPDKWIDQQYNKPC